MLEIFLFIDALGWKIANEYNFLADELPYRQALGMQFGYSCAAIPTLLSGQKPSVHGHLSLFRYAPQASPFRPFAYLAPLFKPDSLWARGRVRNQLSNQLKRIYGFTGYFQIYNMPIKKLAAMDYCEKQNLFIKNGMAPIANLWDMLEETGISFHISDWHRHDAENIQIGIDEIKKGTEFLFLYTAELDGLLHQHIRNPEKIAEKLRWYEERIRPLLAAAKASCPNARITVVSDHGMTPLTHTIDVMTPLETSGLRFGKDYGACFDSTLARFYYLNGNAKTRIRSIMQQFSADCHLLPPEEEARYGIARDDRLFGDDIYLANPGVQIIPSDMGRRPLNGMHGYAPEDADSVASLLSNAPLPAETRDLADVFHLMQERANAIKEAQR